MENKIRIITHSGNFHTDEVFACAALSILLDDRGEAYEIIRTRDPEVIKTGDLVVDIGGEHDTSRGRFDHHQAGGAGARENGIEYSSLGLVWDYFGEELCGSKRVADAIDRRLVQPIDAADNGTAVYEQVFEGVHPYLIHDIIVAYRPSWKEGERHDVQFREMMEIARHILKREMLVETDKQEGEELVRHAYEQAEDKRVIILDGHYPWEDVLNDYAEPLYVVKPDHQNGGNWKVKAVRDDMHSFVSRKSLPEHWAGKRNGALEEATGIADAVFCHNDLFIAVAKTKEGALEMARIAVDA